ncbi:hypothetical protein NRS6141_00569 [Bacillus subtilis]|nr:hypothetical protein NRS6141_00569 [Bacillus subtilis]CAF1879631.1 hypothetical protein NRS6204_00543 [Bacillus subtilis]CAF1881587.1 hypothetical protein NRS6205_00543 [Bacillus subtilis]
MKGPWRFHKKQYRGFPKAMQDYNGSVQEGAFNPSINDGKGEAFCTVHLHHLIVSMRINCSVHNTSCGTDDLYTSGLHHCFKNTRRMS